MSGGLSFYPEFWFLVNANLQRAMTYDGFVVAARILRYRRCFSKFLLYNGSKCRTVRTGAGPDGSNRRGLFWVVQEIGKNRGST
jgi:hypothetical protein